MIMLETLEIMLSPIQPISQNPPLSSTRARKREEPGNRLFSTLFEVPYLSPETAAAAFFQVRTCFPFYSAAEKPFK